MVEEASEADAAAEGEVIPVGEGVIIAEVAALGQDPWEVYGQYT